MCSRKKKNSVGITKEKKQYPPIVFVNNPVRKQKYDVIGFDTQVETLKNAIDNGATMIGVIADYGTGKSSMTELLCDRFVKKGNPTPIKINMWDSLTQENVQGEATGVSNLTRSFLFQLANGKNSILGGYVNKLLSKNYGNVSFASSNPWRFGFFAIIAGVWFGLHMMAEVSGTGVMSQLPEYMNKVIPFVKALSPWFLVLGIASLLLGMKKLSVVFSHWKMPTRREVEINDVFDTYRIIAKRIIPIRKRKKRLVFVDDLDRINDKKIIIAFLKELYRFQDSIADNRDRIVFIVSLKPESELVDRIVQADQSSLGKKSDEEAEQIYPKVFDTTLFLKPIHFDDYDSILLRLITSAPEKQAILEDLIGKKIEQTLPSSFRWIKCGTNLTLRDLKDRLNHAIAIMVSLKNKSYENNSAADFNACTAVSYLESQFPSDYYRLIRDEESFARFIKRSYKIVDATKVDESLQDLVKVYIECFGSEKYSEKFVKALCGMVMEKTFKDDFRMYFYTYPKDSHIKTTEERELCNCLLFPNQYPIPSNLDDCVAYAYRTGRNDTIEKTLMSLDIFPAIVIENSILLDQATKVSMTKAFALFYKRVIQDHTPRSDLHVYWERITGIEGDNKVRFINLCIQKVAELSDPEKIIQKRLEIIKGPNTEILTFKKLFNGIRDVPQITKEEIDSIGDPDIYVPLISVQNIEPEQGEYLCAALNSTQLVTNEGTWSKAVDVIKTLIEVSDCKRIGSAILEFLKINEHVDDAMFSVVCSANLSHEQIADYINILAPSKLSPKYLKLLNLLGFSAHIREEVVYSMMEQTLFFTPILFYSNNNNLHRMDKFLGAMEEIRAACEQLNVDHPGTIVAFRKHCLMAGAEQLKELFFDRYPLITAEEYGAFKRTSDAVRHINTEKIDVESVSELLQVIYAREYSPEELIDLFEYLFIPNVNTHCIDDTAAIETLLDEMDFQRLGVKQLTYEQRSRLYASFSDQHSITDSEDAISFTKRFGCFIPEVEKIISEDKTACTEYCDLIVELDELTDIALRWTEKYYFTAPASERLCNILFDKERYDDYIIATILREKRMVIDSRIDFDVYINIYINVDEVFNIMSDHWEFLGRLQSEADFSLLSENQIVPIFKVPQIQRFFEYMLANKTPLELKKRYLKEFTEFKAEKDSVAFQKLICKSENIKLVDSIDLKNSIYERLWDSNRAHKGVFTRTWNKAWGSKLLQEQPV